MAVRGPDLVSWISPEKRTKQNSGVFSYRSEVRLFPARPLSIVVEHNWFGQ